MTKTIKELLDEYAGIVYAGFDKTIEEQNRRKNEIISQVEALVRKETVEGVLQLTDFNQYPFDSEYNRRGRDNVDIIKEWAAANNIII